MDRLAGKRAVVTGAAQGIGRATAELFLREGAEVIALDVQDAPLRSLAGCTPLTVDLLDAAAVDALGTVLGTLDILVNCAGYVDAGDLLTTSERGYQLSFDLNVHAAMRMIRVALPAMLDAGRGAIVNVASVAGPMIGVPNRMAYCASKAALGGLTRSVALDYVARGIRCNAVCPGTVQSPSLDERLSATGDAAAARAAFVARQPMGRIGTAEEVAAMILYLASDESAYVTGCLMAIDGGWTAA